MNYQGPYYKNKPQPAYIKRLSAQLMAVLIIMLLFLLIKYVDNNITSSVNEKLREIFYKDYTEETAQVFNSFLPDTYNSFLKITKQDKEFKLDYLPVTGKIIVHFGEGLNPVTKKSEFHNGIDIETAEGAEVKAVYDGRVERIENDKELGVTIVINHGNGFESCYGNLSDIKVSEGEKITKGSIIGITGKDSTSKPNLHFELKKNGEAVNPMDYIKESQI